MGQYLRQPRRQALACGWAVMALLAWTGAASAQVGGVGAAGGAGSTGFTGSALSGSSVGSAFGGATTGGGFGSSTFGGGFGTGFGQGTSGSALGTTLQGYTSSTGAGTTGGVSPTNPFAAYYANPLAAGLPNATGRTTFGQPLYGTTTGVTASLTTGPAGLSGGYGASGGMPYGATGIGRQFTPFVATLAFPSSRPSASQLRAKVEGILRRSSSLASKNKIQVAMVGQTIILRGAVSDDHERRLAEALVRLTPGVHGVRNELTVP